MQEDLSRVVDNGDVVLNDGASIHRVQSTVNILNDITNGRYIKVARYSHELSLVEKEFANVWNNIHYHYDASRQSPVAIINKAFTK